MGDHNVEESISQLDEGNYIDAFRLLHFGVARSPGNLEGRKLIADFYEFGRKRPSIAADYLLAGLDHGGFEDIEYLQKLLRMLLRNQMDEKVQEIADTYLSEEPSLTDINRTLALGAASSNYQRGLYDQAEDYLLSYNLLESVEGLLIYSKISWDRGNHTAAISKLEQMMQRFSDMDPLLAQLSNYYCEIGDSEKARRFAILRNVKNPSNYKTRIELMLIYNQEGDTEREASEIERMFEQFHQDEAALMDFSGYAAKTGNVALAKRILKVATKNEFDTGAFTILLLEAHIVSEDYQSALDFCETLVEQQAEWLKKRWAVFNGLRTVAAFAVNQPDLGEVYLQNFLKDMNQRPQTYLSIINHFLAIDRPPQARKLLTIAYQQFPKNQKILSEFIRIELELGNTENINDLLVQLLKMRRPQPELLSKAYRELSSDRFIFTKNRDILLMKLSTILKGNENASLLGANIL